MADSSRTTFIVQIDADVAAAARAAATLHGIDIQTVVEHLVTTTLAEYAEKVRKAIPKPEVVGLMQPKPELSEKDIPF